MKAMRLTIACLPLLLGTSSYACGGASGTGFGDGGGGGFGGDSGPSSDGNSTILGDATNHFGDGGVSLGDSGGGSTDGSNGGDVIVTTVTTVYAHTDTALYTLDPSTNAVTLVGSFAGMGDSAYNEITDLAVNAENEVYVNTETQVFKAAVPSSPGPVNLTPVATLATAKDQYFYALAFAPAGVLGSGETLVGGDNVGNLYAIDLTTTPATLKNLGNFGGVPGSTTGEIFALSGDLVFYTDATAGATGLATIRQCTAVSAGSKSSSQTCTKTNDYLAGIDMTALATAYTSGTPATSLLSGIYGGSSTSIGSGTSYGEIFGLGAWEGNVYGFTREYTDPTTKAAVSPKLVSISTSTGAGSVISSSFPFTTDGWSGAGVTTKVTVTVPKPPPAPPQPK
jgi:hypothetical protein